MTMVLMRRGRLSADGRRQSGAALYVALIMLLLLAMIGIVGLQVTGMQERMAANYMRVNIAFQNAEGLAKETERAIQASKDPATGALTYAEDDTVCVPAIDPLTWAETIIAGAGEGVRVSKFAEGCIPAQGSMSSGHPVSTTNPLPSFQVDVVASDDTGNPSSASVISTIFRPH